MLVLVWCVNSLELTLMDSSTCVAYLIEKDSRFVFEFHYNPEFGTVNMRVYGKDGKFLAETGVKSDYENSISLHYSEEGEYQLCFEKLTPGPMEVYFEVNEHEEDTGELGVGKEDLNLLAKRISAYLSQLKTTADQYKSILGQIVDRRQQSLTHHSESLWLYVLKTVAMLTVMIIQVLVIRKVYD